MNTKWYIDQYILDDSYHEPLDKILEELGVDYQITEYKPFLGLCDKNIPKTITGPVLGYGSVEMIRELHNYNGVPIAYYRKSDFLSSYYMSMYPINWFVNHDFIQMPFKTFVDRSDWLYKLFQTDTLFIRPNSGEKTFTGIHIPKDDFSYEINTLNHLTSVNDFSDIIVASAKNISSEYRFFIIENQVVSASQYKKNGELYVSEEIDETCYRMAEKVAKYERQLDIAYVCDIGLVDGEPKIVEFNCINCSGFYKADIRKIVKTLSDAARKEYDGLISKIT